MLGYDWPVVLNAWNRWTSLCIYLYRYLPSIINKFFSSNAIDFQPYLVVGRVGSICFHFGMSVQNDSDSGIRRKFCSSMSPIV